MPLVVDSNTLGRIIVIEETDTEYNPLFEIYYTDEAEDCPVLIRGRQAALDFAWKLVSLYNGAIEGGFR